MTRRLRFFVTTRLTATALFLCYLAAGASFALPSLVSCVRCAKEKHHTSTHSGTHCPLSYDGQQQDCHGSNGKSTGSITLCPDGCLRHDGQESEVAALAKFVSPPDALVPVLAPLTSLAAECAISIPTHSLSPPDPPPSLQS